MDSQEIKICNDMEMRNRMRQIIAILLVTALLCAGCGTSQSNKDVPASQAEDVTQAQNTKQTESGSESSLPEETTEEDTQSVAQEDTGYAANGVDYDLTEMDGDMVYAMVYQLMIDPETYIGKTFRIRGQYSMVYVKSTGNRYHYCIIKDALACCAQGLEFVWDDGSHVYPDEYPKEDQEIEVKGTFETYQEQGDDNLYCRLTDASLQVEE